MACKHPTAATCKPALHDTTRSTKQCKTAVGFRFTVGTHRCTGKRGRRSSGRADPWRSHARRCNSSEQSLRNMPCNGRTTSQCKIQHAARATVMLKTTAGAERYCCAPYKLRLAAQAIMRPHSAWWCSGAVQPLKMEMEIAAQPTLSPFPVQHCAATLQSGRLLHGYSLFCCLRSVGTSYLACMLDVVCRMSHVLNAVFCDSYGATASTTAPTTYSSPPRMISRRRPMMSPTKYLAVIAWYDTYLVHRTTDHTHHSRASLLQSDRTCV